MFALDVVMVLLEVVEERPEHQELPLEAGQAELLTRRFLVQTLVFGRSSDVSPTVRAHALHCLSRCLDLQSQNTTRYVQELFQASESVHMSSHTQTTVFTCLLAVLDVCYCFKRFPDGY